MSNLELKIFFSWQMSTLCNKKINNKTFLLDCLDKAAKKLSNKGEFQGVKFIIDEGLRKKAGDKPVAETCIKKIKECHIYVADFTIETKFTNLRHLLRKYCKFDCRSNVNGSVLIEYGHAKECLGDDGVILMMNTINGDPSRITDLLPYDCRQNRNPILFEINKTKFTETERNSQKYLDFQEKRQQLVDELVGAIKLAARSAIKNIYNHFQPFISCEKAFNESGYRTDFKWTTDLIQIKNAIQSNRDIMRVVGLSGLGKTRLVLEALLESQDTSHKLYCDVANNEEREIFKTIESLFDGYGKATIILDNCPYYFLEKVYDMRRGKNATNPIIAIDNDPNEKIDNLRYQEYRLAVSDEIVEDIIAKNADFFSPENKKKIIEFSGGIPFIAELLLEGWRKTKEIGNISNRTLITKLLGADERSENRIIAQSLSLFNSLGIEDDVRKEMIFVATNKNITSIEGENEIKERKFDTLIHDYLGRRLLDRKGRFVFIRPLPIAWYLMCEWLTDCSKDRLRKVLEDIRTSEVSASLAPAFGAQFKDMSMSGKAIEMLDEILHVGSPFSDAEVINTEVGSRLFRSFVEVAPQTVAKCLYNALANKKIIDLYNIVEGRRNLVWTIEKLCFNPITFTKGAKLMLRLGCAEIEDISNNATGQFVALFPIYLPATAVSLKERIIFLQREINDEEQKKLILRAVDRALNTSNFIYFNGAEVQGQRKLENYRPKSSDEVDAYISSCLDIIYKEIEQGTEYRDYCINVLSENFRALSAFGEFDIVIPYVKKVAKILDYEWENMKMNLYLAIKDEKIACCNRIKDELKALIDNFTKDTFEARFSMVEKFYASDVDFKDINNQLDYKKKKAKYEALAVEMAEKKLFTKDTLQVIYNCETYQAQQFGRKLATLLSKEEQMKFIENSLEVLPENCTSIIVDFIAMVDEDVFAQTFDIVKQQGRYNLLFSIVAIRDYKFQGKYIDLLYDLVLTHEADISNFIYFWNYSPIITLTSDEAAAFLSRILSLPNSYETVLHMVSILYIDGRSKDNQMFDKIFEQEVFKSIDRIQELMQNPHYTQVLCSLLSNSKRDQLAKSAMSGIINYIIENHNISITYNVEEILSILLEKYFDVTWDILAQAMSLEKDEEGKFYNLYWILGSMSIYNKFPSLIFTKEHERTLLDWCAKNPDVNAYRLMSIAPMLNGDNFSDIVIQIINLYGNRNLVLTALSDKLNSFASTGSALPIYDSRIKLAETLINHRLPEVSAWATLQVEKLKQAREQTRKFEEELTIPGRMPLMN
ncbi:hypothetical protein [Phocaeicola vulgatus]|jgi:hypothetical protein|uniref:hypothetical protein n=1 Tax=Phocaeicola vulgatus TaxID=821 RepID=UPI001E4EB9ED|nr:hypothetical protein [Phocaeicola vulgatus]BDC07554.1 hypothetical protein GAIMETA21S03_34370 [Phocaeicola vulgatus]BDC15735.1 hypothetical protein GAIMETA21S10_34990 [Phocaeicola vulgatus]